jgi:hypothetical protein
MRLASEKSGPPPSQFLSSQVLRRKELIVGSAAAVFTNTIPICNGVCMLDSSVSLGFRPAFCVSEGSDPSDKSLFVPNKCPHIQ